MKNRPQDMVFDFLEMLFSIALVGFFFYYFIVLNNFAIAVAITKVAAPIGVFGLLLIFKVKQSKEKYRKYLAEDNLDEILFYISTYDRWLDRVMIILTALFIYFSAFFLSLMDYIDYYQVILFCLVMGFWHYLFFIKVEEGRVVPVVSRLQLLKDELVIYLIPIYLLAPPIVFRDLGAMDIFQALGAFFIMYSWRLFLYKKVK